MNYKDVQIPSSVGCTVGGVQTFCGITTNAAKARLQGFEAEANAVLARDFAGAGSNVRFNGTVGFIDAKYKRFIGAAGTALSVTFTVVNECSRSASARVSAGGGRTRSWASRPTPTRSAERRVGTGWVRTCRSRWVPPH